MRRNITLQFEDESDWALVLTAINLRITKGEIGESVQQIRGRAVAAICREIHTMNGLGDRHVDLPSQSKLPLGVIP